MLSATPIKLSLRCNTRLRVAISSRDKIRPRIRIRVRIQVGWLPSVFLPRGRTSASYRYRSKEKGGKSTENPLCAPNVIRAKRTRKRPLCDTYSVYTHRNDRKENCSINGIILANKRKIYILAKCIFAKYITQSSTEANRG